MWKRGMQSGGHAGCCWKGARGACSCSWLLEASVWCLCVVSPRSLAGFMSCGCGRGTALMLLNGGEGDMQLQLAA